MKQIKFEPAFVNTKNVRNVGVMMDGIALGEGEGRLGIIYSRAGRGKSRTCQWYSAHHPGCVYLRIASIWKSSELDFLKALCREVGIVSPPPRKGPCYIEIIESLLSEPRPVFLDEPEKLPRTFLDLIRDISDMSTAPFILIGEEELLPYMRRNRRVWSRTYQQLEFKPIETSDIIVYAVETTGLKLNTGVASIMHKASGGDFRIIRRDLLNLVQIVNAKQTIDITGEMVKIAIKTGLTGNR